MQEAEVETEAEAAETPRTYPKKPKVVANRDVCSIDIRVFRFAVLVASDRSALSFSEPSQNLLHTLQRILQVDRSATTCHLTLARAPVQMQVGERRGQ